MDLNHIQSVYFIGAGGIGMSALVRYFLAKGKQVAGYDRTNTPLTEQLIDAGAQIHFVDDVQAIPAACTDPQHTLVVYTPAVPAAHTELNWFRANGFEVIKRSRALGLITRSADGLCIAGTHGKTTVSSMTAHLLKQSHVDCNAFLGGLVKNYDSNLLLSDTSRLTVIEADEYDRSFHQLTPYMAVITSADPDHLDIYGTPEAYRESFEHFTSLIRPDGLLIVKKGAPVTPRIQPGVRLYTYSMTDHTADFHADNILIDNGTIRFDFIGPSLRIADVQLGVPVLVNIENGIAAMALAWLNGATPDELRNGMRTFAGTKRRFDFQLVTDAVVYLDDYAHHPDELRQSILSVRALYPGRRITAIFQPHLYSRTRDFADEFAQSLSLADELILLDIYPAREEPIPGVDASIIFDQVTIADKWLCRKEQLLELLRHHPCDIVMTLGAGDIDRCVTPIKELLQNR